jgi:hypothetical protein
MRPHRLERIPLGDAGMAFDHADHADHADYGDYTFHVALEPVGGRGDCGVDLIRA